jgi:hypothetical protein
VLASAGGRRPAPTNRPRAAIAQHRPTSQRRPSPSTDQQANGGHRPAPTNKPRTLRSLWSSRRPGRPWFFGGKHRPRVFLLLARGSGWVPRAAVVRPPPVFGVVVGDVVRVRGCGLAGR